ncbi:hypothetical protein PHYSODRAFT_245934 [Phytophthora sojae]|uniref:Uncharacterized protein n=1 Tax=Phytophthora sojae (strain P6497) TaxID=1094619 RepID=G4Z585_PHYSP|nr:hypothetical protein PHYSODRAFT_245934 [Phytophthora sojae]EGZ20228.1 hypothetical protein PHYSODRAFT_245934 [Phytophthora sojae]|eukprot:XP_009522945.1 hypothetical protein PHYSODRAFT_245934 [Phytophthora sojae]
MTVTVADATTIDTTVTAMAPMSTVATAGSTVAADTELTDVPASTAGTVTSRARVRGETTKPLSPVLTESAATTTPEAPVMTESAVAATQPQLAATSAARTRRRAVTTTDVMPASPNAKETPSMAPATKAKAQQQREATAMPGSGLSTTVKSSSVLGNKLRDTKLKTVTVPDASKRLVCGRQFNGDDGRRVERERDGGGVRDVDDGRGVVGRDDGVRGVVREGEALATTDGSMSTVTNGGETCVMNVMCGEKHSRHRS